MGATKAPLPAHVGVGMQVRKAAAPVITTQDLSHRSPDSGGSAAPAERGTAFPAPLVLDMAQGGRPQRVSYPPPWRPVVVTSRSRNRRDCRRPRRRAYHVPGPCVH